MNRVLPATSGFRPELPLKPVAISGIATGELDGALHQGPQAQGALGT